MSTQLAAALGGLVFSMLLFILCLILIPKKSAVLRKFLSISTALYTSGTALILILTIYKPALPLLWTGLCEAFIFAVYAANSGIILFTAKKFAGGSNPPANRDSDKK